MDYKKVFLGSEEIRDMLPETYFSQNKGKLFVLINTSCSNEKRKGNYRIMLKYNSSKKLITNNLNNVSDAGECALLGIKESLKAINMDNCEINIVTGIGLGFQGTLNKGKSSHKDLVYAILDEASQKGHKIKELVFKGNSNAVKQVIDMEFPLSKTKSNDPKEKALDLKSYSIALTEEIEKNMLSRIVNNMKNLRFNDETIAKVCMISVNEVNKLSTQK